MSRIINLTDRDTLTGGIRCPICDTENFLENHLVDCKLYLDGSYMISPQLHTSTFAVCSECGYIYRSATGLYAAEEERVRNIIASDEYKQCLQITNETEKRLSLLLQFRPNALRYNLWMMHFYTEQQNEPKRLEYLNKVITLAKQRLLDELTIKAHDFNAIKKLEYRPRTVCDADTDCVEFSYNFFLIDWLRQAGRFDEALHQIAKCKRKHDYGFEKAHLQYLNKEESLIKQHNTQLL